MNDQVHSPEIHFQPFSTLQHNMEIYWLSKEAIPQGPPVRTSQNTVGVGKEGKMLHGRIDKGAAAIGPGMKTTNHHKTDGVSLMTLASGPWNNQKVKLILIKSQPP